MDSEPRLVATVAGFSSVERQACMCRGRDNREHEAPVNSAGRRGGGRFQSVEARGSDLARDVDVRLKAGSQAGLCQALAVFASLAHWGFGKLRLAPPTVQISDGFCTVTRHGIWRNTLIASPRPTSSRRVRTASGRRSGGRVHRMSSVPRRNRPKMRLEPAFHNSVREIKYPLWIIDSPETNHAFRKYP